MSTPLVTPWFLGNVKPVRVGVYERLCWVTKRITYSYWNGRRWCVGFESPELAARCQGQRSNIQDREWRGLAQDPGVKHG